MLQITTTNGDTLIHGDDRPKATIRSYDGSEVIVHAGAWGQHKYIRKEGNRYIYPEDLQREKSGNRPQGRNRTNVSGQMEVKKGQSAGHVPVGNDARPRPNPSSSPKSGVLGVATVDEKKKKGGGFKDQKFLAEKRKIHKNIDNAVGVEGATDIYKQTEQLTNAHKRATLNQGFMYGYKQSNGEPTSSGVAEQMKKTAHRKEMAKQKEKTAQRKAHKEEMERQKEKTAQRKQAKETVERTSDTLERMRNKALKKRNRG